VRCEGSGLLLDRLADSLSLTRILREAFPEDWNKILTCAYYLINEGKALSHVETWSAHHSHPYGETLPSQRVSELLQAVTAEKQLAFFKHWVKTRAESEYVAMDITSVSSYGKQNEYVHYGYNRDGESLPQINLCLLLGEESGIPIYYESLNGSIKDVSTLENVLKVMGWLNANRLHAVMDRGFYSERNIDNLYDKHIRFTVGVPFTTKWTRELVSKVRDSIEGFDHYHRLGGYTFFADTDTTTWKGHRCYRHVYYDSKKASAEYTDFLEKIELWRAELEENKPVEENRQNYDRYFDVKETLKHGRRVMVRNEAVQAFKQKTAGFFVLISNDIKDPVGALKIYRDKDAVEKGFDNLKNTLDMNRLRIHSAGAMRGRLFIQFIAQILMAAIRNVMVSSKLDEKYTLPELVNELKSIHSVRLDGHRKPIFTKSSKPQNDIFAAFGISDIPYV
jgi:transposase